MTTESRPGVPHARTRLLLRRGAFRTLWLSRSVSYAGEGIGRTALVLLMAPQGATAVGLALLANTLPRFLGPIAGALADRVEQRRLMMTCELGQAAMFAVIALLLPPLPLLFPLILVASGLATAFAPAGRGVVPTLVPAANLGRANALLGTAFNVQLAVGPAIGGLAVGIAGPRFAFAINAVAFVLSALVLAGLPTIRPRGSAADGDGLLASTFAGLRYVATAPAPRALVIMLFVVVSFAAIDNVALVFLVEGDLGGSPGDFGLVQACFGIGMIGMSLVLGVVAGRLSLVVLLIGGTVLFAAATAGTALVSAVAMAAVLQALAGAGNGSENIATDTLIQRLVPREFLGRAFGAVGTAAQLGLATAFVAAGPLVSATGARTAFLVAGIGSAGALIAIMPVLRVLTREHRDMADDAPHGQLPEGAT